MATRQYIGARYVPKFSDVNGGVWDNTYAYEALTIVKHGNDYYTSRVPVPTGANITDSNYWVKTGDYNGAIQSLDTRVSDIEEILAGKNVVTPEEFGAIGDGIADDTAAIAAAIDNGCVVMTKRYKITAPIALHGNVVLCYGSIVADNCDGVIITGLNGYYYFNEIAGNSNNRAITISSPSDVLITEHNHIEVGNIYGFHTGIYLTADNNKGVQYNTIMFRRISTCTYGIYAKLTSVMAGWINSNHFIGGRLGSDLVTCVYLYNEDGLNKEINGNIFDAIGFEGSSSTAIILRYATDNMFNDCRMAEAMSGTYWVDLYASGRNKFIGNLHFTTDKIRDDATYLCLGNSDTISIAMLSYNTFMFNFATIGTDTWLAQCTLYTYNNCKYIDMGYSTRSQVYNLSTLPSPIKLDEYAYLQDIPNMSVNGSQTVILPVFFGSKMHAICFSALGNTTLTVNNYDGTNVATITLAYGETAVLFQTSTGVKFFKAS